MPSSLCKALFIYAGVMAYSSRPPVVGDSELVDSVPISVVFLSITAPPDEPFWETTVPPTDMTSMVPVSNVERPCTVVTALVTFKSWSMEIPPRNPAGYETRITDSFFSMYSRVFGKI